MNDTRELTLAGLLATQNQTKLARLLNKSRNMVNGWATGKTVPVDTRDIVRLATVLHYDLADLTRIIAADAERIAQQRSAA